MTHLFTSNQESIQIAHEPLGRGGEGNVFEVESPSHYQGMVAKIYHPRERNKARELKLCYLLAKRPHLPDSLSVMWVEEILYQGEQFVGFLMRKAKSAQDLSALCSSRIPRKLGEAWQKRYSRHNFAGLKNRLKVCLNLATALADLHQTGHFVLVDIKPENVKVRLDGQISIIDVDSMEVIREGKMIFPAEKTSPEYSPWEIAKIHVKKDYIAESWDRFSMAVVFYKVLMGLHPYAGTCLKPYEKLESHQQKIRQGMFPLGYKKDHFRVIPEPHQGFYQLPESLQDMFMKCFDSDRFSPEERPRAEAWRQAFAQVGEIAPIAYYRKQTGQASVSRRPPQASNLPQILKGVGLAALAITISLSGSVMLGNLTVSQRKIKVLKEPEKTIPLKKVVSRAELSKKLGYVDHFHEGAAKMKKNGKYGYTDPEGKILIPYKYDWADRFQEGLARTAREDKYGFVNKDGREVIPMQYDWVGRFVDGIARVSKLGQVSYVDQNNQAIGQGLAFDFGKDFVNGFARVKRDDFWSFINTQGQTIVPFAYQKTLNFYEGMAAVCRNGLWGFVNQYGVEVIPCQYHWATSFVDGKAMVMGQGGTFYINAQNQKVSKPRPQS